MNAITMEPVSRFAWPGTHPTFRVGVYGAEDIKVVKTSSEAVHADIECIPTGGGGCHGILQLEVEPKAGFECVDVELEARDESGALAHDHVELVLASRSAIIGMLLVGLAGMALAWWGFAGTGTLAMTGAVLGVFVAAVGILSFAASLAGRMLGMPWHFTA